MVKICEVQFIRRLNKKKNGTLTKDDIRNFFGLMDSGSYSNRDAYGFFTNTDYLYRKGVAFYEESTETRGGLTKNILSRKPSFLVGHNRLTTQGDGKKNFNNHPFPREDWVIVHNGVLRNDTYLASKYRLAYKEETDSAIIVDLLQKFTDDGLAPDVCVKNVAEELEGSFSVMAYNKTTDRLFYFKNSSTSFYFRLYELNDGSEILVGSTKDDNFDDVYVEERMIFYQPKYAKYYQTEAYEGTIYEIDDMEIFVVEYFTPAKTTTSYGTDYYSTKSSSTKKEWARYGGMYSDDWNDDDLNFEYARDIDYVDKEGQIVPSTALARKKKFLLEDAQSLQETIDECLGVGVNLTISYPDSSVVYEIPESYGMSMSEICSKLKETHDVIAEPHDTNSIAVTFAELDNMYN